MPTRYPCAFFFLFFLRFPSISSFGSLHVFLLLFVVFVLHKHTAHGSRCCRAHLCAGAAAAQPAYWLLSRTGTHAYVLHVWIVVFTQVFRLHFYAHAHTHKQDVWLPVYPANLVAPLTDADLRSSLHKEIVEEDLKAAKEAEQQDKQLDNEAKNAAVASVPSPASPLHASSILPPPAAVEAVVRASAEPVPAARSPIPPPRRCVCFSLSLFLFCLWFL